MQVNKQLVAAIVADLKALKKIGAEKKYSGEAVLEKFQEVHKKMDELNKLEEGVVQKHKEDFAELMGIFDRQGNAITSATQYIKEYLEAEQELVGYYDRKETPPQELKDRVKSLALTEERKKYFEDMSKFDLSLVKDVGSSYNYIYFTRKRQKWFNTSKWMFKTKNFITGLLKAIVGFGLGVTIESVIKLFVHLEREWMISFGVMIAFYFSVDKVADKIVSGLFWKRMNDHIKRLETHLTIYLKHAEIMNQ